MKIYFIGFSYVPKVKGRLGLCLHFTSEDIDFLYCNMFACI